MPWKTELSVVWLLLLTATGMTAWLTETRHGLRWATIAILLTAAVKIALIMSEFMELRTAPRAWRLAYSVWLAVVTVIVLSGFVFV